MNVGKRKVEKGKMELRRDELSEGQCPSSSLFDHPFLD
jgi:hypothetical protein